MKYCIALACLAAVAYGVNPEAEKIYREKLHKYGGECKTEVGASDDDVAPMKAHQPPTTEKGKCMVACMNKKFGFQDADGKISKDGSYAVIEKVKPLDEELYGKLKKMAETCLGQVSDEANECDTAAKMFECVKQQQTELGIVPVDY